LAGEYYNNFFNNVPIGIHRTSEISPDNFYLYQNYPNPFNSSTVIKFSIPKKSFVKLKVYDILGREIKSILEHEFESGSYEFRIDLNSFGLASGIYFYSMNAKNFRTVRRMVVLK
jgi:type IX secretion system substrate protein